MLTTWLATHYVPPTDPSSSPLTLWTAKSFSAKPFLDAERDKSNEQKTWKSDLPRRSHNRSKLTHVSLYLKKKKKPPYSFHNKQDSKTSSGQRNTHIRALPRPESVTVQMGKTDTPISLEVTD